MSRRQGAPRAAAAASLRRVVLDNGLVVISRESHAPRSVAVRLMLPAGAAFDPPGASGTAALISGLLDRGAGGLSAVTIAEGFDFLGVSYLARARTDSLDIDLRLLSDHLEEVLDRLRILVSEPEFPEEELRRERGQLLTAIAERDQDTGAVAADALFAALYPVMHPYHAPDLGTHASVAAIGRDDLVAFQRRRLVPAGSVLVLTGGVGAARALDLAAKLFDSWPGGPSPSPNAHRSAVPDVPPPERPVTVVKPIEGKSQADVALGFLPGIRRLSPDLPAALVLNNALGEFGLGGRLAMRIREQEGLAYYAHSYLSAGLGAGPLVVRAGVRPAKVRRAADLMRRTIDAVLKRGLTSSEIRDSKLALASAVPRRLESNPGAASLLAECEFHGLGVDYPEREPDLIASVDRAQVEEAAHTYLTLGRHALVVAGPNVSERDLS